jgi:hypothetical protein
MSLTLCASGTTTTVSDAGGVDHTHRCIVFAASLLRRERGPLPATPCAISLREKVLSPQTSFSCCMCPAWRRDQMLLPRKALETTEREYRGGGNGGETHRGGLPLLYSRS